MSTRTRSFCIVIGLLSVLGSRAQAERFDQLVGAVAPNGGAYLVKHFSVPGGSVIEGLTFYSNDLETTFPWVAILEGPAKALSEATALAEFANVQPSDTHRTAVSCTPITVSSSADLYVAIQLPSSTGIEGVGNGAGVAAKLLEGSATSYFVSGRDGVFGEMDVDYGIDLVFSQVGKATVSEPEPARIEVFLRATNPVRSGSLLEFGVEQTSAASLTIYDVTGRRVRTFVQGTLVPGIYSELWDGRDQNGGRVAAGIYFAKLIVGDRVLSQKLLVAR